MKHYVKDAFNLLKEKDTYSLLLFILYNLKVIPGYRTLVELMYVINKDNLLKLCQYYGGKTITLPTTEDLYKALNILKMYEKIDINKDDPSLVFSNYSQEDIETYKFLKDIISNYEFETDRESVN